MDDRKLEGMALFTMDWNSSQSSGEQERESEGGLEGGLGRGFVNPL